MESMHPLSEPQIYTLAEQARVKLMKQWGAQDHDLRLLIAHAHLYDDLDVHVERMKAKRRKRNSTEKMNEHSLVRKAAFTTEKQDQSKITVQDPPEGHAIGSKEVVDCAETHGTTESTINNKHVDSSTESKTHANSPMVDLSNTSYNDGPSTKAHTSSAVAKSPVTYFDMINMPNSIASESQVTVSELAIDDDSSLESASNSESDCDSDSDSNSDFDAERDSAVIRNENNKTPINNPDLKDTLSHKMLNHKGEIVFHKTVPLPPQLHVEGIDAVSNFERDNRLRQALAELPVSCTQKASTQNAIRRWLSSFAY